MSLSKNILAGILSVLFIYDVFNHFLLMLTGLAKYSWSKSKSVLGGYDKTGAVPVD